MDCRHWKQWKVLTSTLVRSCCAGAILMIFASGAAAAPVYTAQDLGSLPGGSDASYALDINDSGHVVGFSDSSTKDRAFLWEPGSGMTALRNPPGRRRGQESIARGINNSGQVVGVSDAGDGRERAYVWEPGGDITDLGDLISDRDLSDAWAISDSGRVVGFYASSNRADPHPFLLDTEGRMVELEGPSGEELIGYGNEINASGQVAGQIANEFGGSAYPPDWRWAAALWDADGRLTDLGHLPGSGAYSQAFGINDHGQVVGDSYSTNGTQAFLWEAGTGMTGLGDLPGGDAFSVAYAINNSGQVVGRSTAATGNHAFLWEADLGMLQLDTLIDPLDPLFGIRLFEARAINNSGQIAAIASTDGNFRAFLLTPKPRVFLHCSRDLSADGTVGIAVVTEDQVTVKALDGTLISQFSLNGLDDVIDTELMADTNGNGAPELVVLSRSSARVVVRDLLSGADLGTIEFPADLAPIGLELGEDRTGNGIPDLAAVGRDPARVQVRDGLTSILVSDVDFSRYVTAKDLTLYPDLDGSGALALAVLAENRRPEHADKIEIRNASSGETIREIWLGKDWQVLEQDRIGDLNGNGSEEVAVLQQEPRYLGGVRVQIRDIETSAWVNFVGFANKYPPQTLVTIPDINGNGADELSVFGRHVTGTNQKAVIKDAKTGDKLNQLWFDRDFPGQDFVSCGDINGNGAADLALLGHRPEDGQLQVTVKDSGTGERLGLVWF